MSSEGKVEGCGLQKLNLEDFYQSISVGEVKNRSGRIPFYLFWGKVPKSIIPKCYLCCSEKTGFCDF